MKHFTVDVLSFTGTSYDIGRQQGVLMKETPLFAVHTKRRPKSIKAYETKFREAYDLFAELAPTLNDELHGLADGLGWSVEETYHEYSGWQADWKRSGCTAMMQQGFYARNYDYHPKTYEGRFVLTKPSDALAIIGFSQRMMGRIDGMNEAGLCIGYHFVNRLRAKTGLICPTIARIILQQCRSTAEAIEMLRRIPHRHAFNYSLYDANGVSAIVEASGEGVEVRQKPVYFCVNHFETEAKLRENRHRFDHSLARQDVLTAREHHPFSPLDAFRLFNERGHGIFSDDYRNWTGTVHTAVYVPQSLSAIIGVGGDAVPATFHFGTWLQGERLWVKQLRGKISEEFSFPHEGV